MNMNKDNLLSDEALEKVGGGMNRTAYNDNQLKAAGVTVSNKNGKRIFTTTLSNGQKLELSESTANSMADCYRISGGTKLNDTQIMDLVKQS